MISNTKRSQDQYRVDWYKIFERDIIIAKAKISRSKLSRSLFLSRSLTLALYESEDASFSDSVEIESSEVEGGQGGRRGLVLFGWELGQRSPGR